LVLNPLTTISRYEIALTPPPSLPPSLPPFSLPLPQPNLRGDQIVNVVVDFPTKLSSKEKELLQKLRAVQGGATGVGAAAAGGGRGGDKGEGKEKKGGWFGGL